MVKTKALTGLLPLQCYNHCRGQLNIHPQKCHQGGDTGNCILEDPWVAWTCPAFSESPESHLIELRERQNGKRYHIGQHDPFPYARISLLNISELSAITERQLLFQVIFLTLKNLSHSIIKTSSLKVDEEWGTLNPVKKTRYQNAGPTVSAWLEANSHLKAWKYKGAKVSVFLW